MKFVLAICLVLSVVAADDWTPPTQDEERGLRDGCVKSESVPEKTADRLEGGIYPDEPSVRCYVRCLTTKYGVWDDTDGFVWERLTKFLESRKNTVTKEAFDKCSSKNGEELDACTWAYKGWNCFLDNNYFTPLKSS